MLLTLLLAAPIGFLSFITDHGAYGCAIDPDNPAAVVQAHVYSEPGVGTIGLAAYSCPWTTDPRYQGHGFWIQYRRPADSLKDVAVAAVTVDWRVTWLPRAGAVEILELRRASEMFLYEAAAYKVGISTRYGATLMEFYNKRVDSTLNLIQADPGSGVQVALFGTASPSADKPCQASVVAQWNPTQAGSRCTGPDNAATPSAVDGCISDRPGWCVEGAPQPRIAGGMGGSIRWRVRLRNFYYPWQLGAYPFRAWDDAWAWVAYTFLADHVQVDYTVWRTDPTPWGALFQQIPIVFLTQMTRFETSTGRRSRTSAAADQSEPSWQIPLTPATGRWIYAEAIAQPTGTPLMAPGANLTAYFFQAPVAGACPLRTCQLDQFSNDGGVQLGSAIQCPATFEPRMWDPMRARLLLFPGRKIDEPSPDWDCR